MCGREASESPEEWGVGGWVGGGEEKLVHMLVNI